MADSPAPPAKGKKLTLRSPTTWLIVTGVALVFGGYLLWRRSQSSSSASSGSGTSGTATDYSGALGTLQSEIGNLQSSGASGGGTSVVPVGSTSGGAGTVTTTDTGPGTGGNSSGASGGSGSSTGSSSSGSSSSGSSSSGSASSGGTPAGYNAGSWTDTGQTWSANQLAQKLGISESALRGSNRLGEKALGDPNAPIAKGAAFTFLKAA